MINFACSVARSCHLWNGFDTVVACRSSSSHQVKKYSKSMI
uniref:Uncharacterized protein n=1 Tax=Arundo donax TaxID=35708 RepID=A0A0A9GG89_ARUDO